MCTIKYIYQKLQYSIHLGVTGVKHYFSPLPQKPDSFIKLYHRKYQTLQYGYIQREKCVATTFWWFSVKFQPPGWICKVINLIIDLKFCCLMLISIFINNWSPFDTNHHRCQCKHRCWGQPLDNHNVSDCTPFYTSNWPTPDMILAQVPGTLAQVWVSQTQRSIHAHLGKVGLCNFSVLSSR